MSGVGKEKGIGKSKIGLVISGVLIVILAISSLWLYTTGNTLQTDKDDLQTQINNLQSLASSLETWLDGNKTLLQTWLDGNVTDCESQIQNLNSQITTLNSQINFLNTQITSLQNEIDSLEAPQLHRVNVEWSDHHPLFGSPYISISGTIFNSGTNSAYNVILTVKIYDSADTLLKSEELSFGSISGKSYKNFDTDIGYSGDAYYITTTLSYD